MTPSARAMAMVSAAQVAAARNRQAELVVAARRSSQRAAISAAKLAKKLMYIRQQNEWKALRAMNRNWVKGQSKYSLRRIFGAWKGQVSASKIRKIRQRGRY